MEIIVPNTWNVWLTNADWEKYIEARKAADPDFSLDDEEEDKEEPEDDEDEKKDDLCRGQMSEVFVDDKGMHLLFKTLNGTENEVREFVARALGIDPKVPRLSPAVNSYTVTSVEKIREDH